MSQIDSSSSSSNSSKALNQHSTSVAQRQSSSSSKGNDKYTTTTSSVVAVAGNKANSVFHNNQPQPETISRATNPKQQRQDTVNSGTEDAKLTRKGRTGSTSCQGDSTQVKCTRASSSDALKSGHLLEQQHQALNNQHQVTQLIRNNSAATTTKSHANLTTATTAPNDQSGVRGASGSAPAAAGSAPAQQPASTTQRLSSIDILNENRQRQLQFKQQESFKQHLEQRQRQLIQQQKEQFEAGNSANSLNETGADSSQNDDLRLTYQVNTSAPDYIKMASAGGNNKSSTVRGNIAVNPFNDVVANRQSSPQPKATGGPATSKVSGKSGFLSALLDEASFETTTTAAGRRADESDEELNSSSIQGKSSMQQQHSGANQSISSHNNSSTTRYSKVAEAGHLSYNYDNEPDKRPFYQRDFASLLQDLRASRKLVILIVAIALLLDNMLLTSVVPIIPAHLYKLRIERQHRDQLERNNQTLAITNTNSNGTSRQLPITYSEREFEEEVQRRVNQTLATTKDRYSGSIFHPRVRVEPLLLEQQQQQPRKSFNNQPSDDSNGDDDDRYMSSTSIKSSGNSFMKDDEGNGDENDDGDDDDEQQQQVESAARRSGGKSASNQLLERKPMGLGKGKRPRRPPGGASESDEDDSNSNRPGDANKDSDEEANSDSDDDNNNNDDDDEDMNNAKRWMALRSSLVKLAKSSANDTDLLAGMCLSKVLGPQMSGKNQFDTDASEAQVKSRKQQQQQRLKLNQRRPVRALRPKLIKLKPSAGTTTTSTSTASTSTGDVPGGGDSPASPAEESGELIISHQDIVDESFEVGVMFASKPIVQAFANPFIGTLTNRVGFTIPMFTGFVIMFLSTLVFAFGNSYSTLFIARAIQGVGSACTSVAGMSMLADRFPDDAERGNAMAVALGGLALGVVIGPPFGGFMYEFVGKSSPFIVLAVLALLDGLLQLAVLQPRVTKSQEEGASLLTLIKDPYILVAAGAITFANTGIAILEPALPLWMMDTMKAKNWEQGVAFLPAALSYMFGTNLFGNLGLKIGRWRATMIGLVIIGCSLLLIPFATRVDHLIIPNGAIGFAMGMVDSTMMPMLGYLVDIRHTSVYGSVYAIGDVAFCASFAFGPALSGTLVELIGFEGLIITTAFICFGFAPLLFLLRDPPARQVDENQLAAQSLRYVNYNQLDSPDEESAQLTEYRSTGKTYVK